MGFKRFQRSTAKTEEDFSKVPPGNNLSNIKLKPLTEKKPGLDPNHTHFILIDSHEEDKFGGEIELRANLECAISQKWEYEGTG